MTMKAIRLPGLMTAVAAKTAAVLVASREAATTIKTTPTDNAADVAAATNHRGSKGSGAAQVVAALGADSTYGAGVAIVDVNGACLRTWLWGQGQEQGWG